MKIPCTLNGKTVTFNTQADKPLLRVLLDYTDITSLIPRCREGSCGNCIVLLDNQPVMACRIPAFMIRNRQITTLEGFARTRFYTDITRGYEEIGVQPCTYCYPSKTLLIEAVVHENSAPEYEEILDMLDINSCSCVSREDLIAIVKTAVKFRRRRRVRRS